MTQTHHDVPCTACGCVCDDLQVSVDGGRLTPIVGACSISQSWLAAVSQVVDKPPPVARLDGQPAKFDDAIARAAALLRKSRAPLIWGLARSSVDGVRAAFNLAERLGATIDTTASLSGGAAIMALQQVGQSTCTLGEVRHRADLVVICNANPVETHPRLFERYAVDPRGMFVPNGRADRKIVVIDAQPTATSQLADTFIQVAPAQNLELIWALRMLLKGMELPPQFDIGVSHERLVELAGTLRGCQYGVLFFGLPPARDSAPHAGLEALFRLVAELNAFTRFGAIKLGSTGFSPESTLAWLSGFPFAVNLARGYPRYSPSEFSATPLLERGEVDACVLVGSEPAGQLSPLARQVLAKTPTIVLDPAYAACPWTPSVQFTTAVHGIDAPGLASRMDGVSLPLRQLTSSGFVPEKDVLKAILTALA